MMKDLVNLFFVVTWIFGFVVAKGFWATVFCVIPFWSWYLLAEYAFLHLKMC